jgi:hypothetical protein
VAGCLPFGFLPVLSRFVCASHAQSGVRTGNKTQNKKNRFRIFVWGAKTLIELSAGAKNQASDCGSDKFLETISLSR